MNNKFISLILILFLNKAQIISAQETNSDIEKILHKIPHQIGALVDEGKATSAKLLEGQLNNQKVNFDLQEPRTKELEDIYDTSIKSIGIIASAYKCNHCSEWHSDTARMATAWVLETNGIMVTNYEVFKNYPSNEGEIDPGFGVTMYDGHSYPVIEILTADKDADIAIFRIDANNLIPLPLKRKEEYSKVGKKAHIIGHPNGRPYLYNSGHVSRYWKDGKKKTSCMSVTINFGLGLNGAPVLDDTGNLIGMVSSKQIDTFKIDNEKKRTAKLGISHCIPVKSIHRLLGKTIHINPSIVINDRNIKYNIAKNVGTLVDQKKTASTKLLKKQLKRGITNIDLLQPNKQELNNLYNTCADSIGIITSVYKCRPNCAKWHSNQQWPSSAWVLTSDGVMVTTYSVFENYRFPKGTKEPGFGVMMRDGSCFPVTQILAADKNTDIVIFKVDAKNLKPLPLKARNHYQKPGDYINIIGHPNGMYYSYSGGHVSRYWKDSKKQLSWMAIDAEYAIGLKGTPILDNKGNVAGMISYHHSLSVDLKEDKKLTQMITCKSIPVNYIYSLLNKTTEIDNSMVINDKNIIKKLYDRSKTLIDLEKNISIQQLNHEPTEIKLPKPGKNILTNIYDSSIDSVAMITSVFKSNIEDPKWNFTGMATAWVLTSDGIMVTNNHVIESLMNSNKNHNPLKLIMFRNGRCYPIINILAVNKDADIAIFKVDAKNLKPLPLKRMGEDLYAGSKVHILGHPAQRYYSYQSGSVSQCVTNKNQNLPWMLISAELYYGYSGGPVLDRFGNVVGMTSSVGLGITKLDDHEVFCKQPEQCVPVESIYKLLEELSFKSL